MRYGNKNAHQQSVTSRPHANPGRTLLQRVLADGAWSIQQSGAGKARENVVDVDSSVWEKSQKFYAWTRGNRGIALENVLDCDEVCLCYCGHIGWLKHKQAVHGSLADVRHLG